MKYVGNDGVVLGVPESWVVVPPDPCHGTATAPYVTFEASWIVFCPPMTDPPPAHVVIGREWHGESIRGLELHGLVPVLRALPRGWTTVPWAETPGSFYPELDDVQRALEREGLEQRSRTVPDRTLLDGTVLEMDPPMGTVVREGGTVTLTVTTTDAAPTAGASSSP
jgi:hypothetical protein